MPRRPLALLVLSALVSCLLAVTEGPARANVTVNEVYPVPSSGVYPIEGHGWGHGHGMSQYGARGGAQLGKTADQMTAFYYPGTARGTLANVAMRVKLMADDDNRTEVYQETGLRIRNGTSEITGFPTAGVSRYRTVVDSAGLHLQYFSSNAWHGWGVSMAGPVDFFGPTLVQVAFPDGTSRDYRGTIRAVKLTSTTAATVDVLPMESYLRGVVPRESPSGWAAEALKAQAIAARSYSEYKREHSPSGRYYDICDTTSCQVYGGANYYSSSGTRLYGEEPSTDQAVSATAGVIRTYQGAAIFAEFSASNGGWATAGSVPYLVAQRDDWDGVVTSSVHSWSATVSAAQIQARYPAVGTLLRMRVTERDGNGEWGGRVKKVVLEGRDSSGASTSVSTTGAGVYNAHTWPGSSDGLRSSWWHVRPATSSALVGQSVAPRLVQSPGASRATLTATLRNNGTTTWSTSGLHLAVASPVGQADPLVGNSTRPGVYTGTASSVPPDSTAAFSFALTGDGVAPGTYARSYRLRIGSGALFGATVSWQIIVDPAVITATTVSGPTSTGPAPAAPAPGAVLADGRTVVVPIAGSTPLSFTLKNTGNVTWPITTGGPLRLGTNTPHNRTSESSGASWLRAGTRPSSLTASAPVAPGQTGQLALRLYGNGRPVGVTAEAFAPLWESVRWITGADANLVVVRVDPSVPRLATLDRALPAARLTTAPNGTATLTVRLRNVGGSAWSVGSERLQATATALSTSAWPSATEAPRLAVNVTRPAVSAVYPGEVGAWRIPISAFKKAAGSYPMSFRAMSPAGGVYGPTVSTSVSVVAASFTGSLVRTPAPVTVPRDGTVLTSFDVKNTGNADWPVGGSLRSSTSGSPSASSTWVAPTRPSSLTVNATRPGAAVVRPGEVARFRFLLAGNGRVPQSTKEDFGVLWESWLRLPSFAVTISYQVV